jgi:hypothetical protein
MRNYLAEDVLNSTMLNSFKIYKENLGEKGQILNGVIEFLEHTSQLVAIFRDGRPIKEMSDTRLNQLKLVNSWFFEWEENTPQNEKQRNLMSHQCHEDIHSCILGFLDLCETVLKLQTSSFVTPRLINSDVIENIFNQQRSTYNVANSNPNAVQYKQTINSIVLGQTSISKKANAARAHTALPYPIDVKKPALKKGLNTI